MSFGDGIRALLDVYANCISLLKAFRGGQNESGTQPSRLRKSLRRDRSLIEQTYSSRVSEAGSRLSKGDARAIRVLDRILKRLRDAIANLLRLSSKGNGVDLDYDSLMALSNASRIDAIRTIDGLSRRLGATPSRSRVSVASKASSKVSDASKMSKAPKRSTQTTPSKHRRKSSAKPTKVSSVQSTTVAEKTPKAIKPAKATKHDGNGKRKKKRDSHKRRQQAEPETPPPLQTPQSIPQIQISEVIEEDTATTPNNPRISTPAPRNKINNADKRISILSFSSDSTKLGEIPERKWRSVSSTKGSSSGGGDAGQYEVRPVFPLGPYKVEVKERRFLGFFRRRREESS